ncbi:MAG: 5'/3'-nucleotidase SurE [Acidimicrobiia bacterium]|nr:5'/3'-nucleotidase SurE [Acidimicrobiia bacterium]
MTTLLITNDDGIEARALVPFARAMQPLGRVVVVAPDRERSWTGKAISRHSEVIVTRHHHEDLEMWAVVGYPADCVHMGAFAILDEPPDLVLSGINIGANKGSAFSAGSGTLAAAIEASNLGIGGIAFSSASFGVWPEFVRWARSPASDEMWVRHAAIAADIAAAVLDHGFPAGVDLLSVNMPSEADMATARRITTLARTSHGSLFAGDDGRYRHSFDGVLQTRGDTVGSDIAALDAGLVSITPVRMANSAPLSDDLRERLERR